MSFFPRYLKETMAAKDKLALWDPYETSNKREFFYRSSSNTEFTLPATSKTFRDCYSPSGPVGPTGYSEDFCWKAVSKTECIRTGSASGQRRNNPHPSQGFLTWRLPKGASQSSAGGSRFTSEEEIQKALTAQYCSTYRTDFLGLPQGADHINSYGEAGLVPLRSRQQDPHWTRTEMRDNYCRPKKEQLQDNRCDTAYGGNARHRVHCRGIVPTVVQRHIRDRHDVSELTTYDTFFGRKASVVPYVLNALQPQELQQLCKVLPEKDTALMKSLMSKAAGGQEERKERKLPAVTMPASRPMEWISSWPGPH
ncbi:testis-expressed protein 26-like [Gadus macrocephalus]|uniref:testis-expressed protein 26-like n=1 Tax=Gadus macrocephalus TaxID=80720 RepID=UPI0028CB3666|nr:testis-expressed protein 26-like [Gadus macrocephalus]